MTRNAIKAGEVGDDRTPLAAPGPELGRHNRRILAERLRWPAGAAESCEQVEAEHPGWGVMWMDVNDRRGFERPAGYYATRFPDGHRVHGDDAEAVSVAIEQAPSPADLRERRYQRLGRR